MLNFSSRPPFGTEEFIDKCRGLIPEEEVNLLQNICYKDPSSLGSPVAGTIGKLVSFEVVLRNELARARARRKKIDASKFIRLPDDFEAHISHTAMAAYRSLSILEAEKILDQARWDFLEFLSIGHYFDFDFLVVYLLKLKILVRWDNVQRADKEGLFKQAVGS